MADLSMDEVRRILELVAASDVEYLELQYGDVRLVTGSAPPPTAVPPSTTAPVPAPAPPPPPVSVPAPAPPPPYAAADAVADAGTGGTAPDEEGSDEGLVAVTAPVVGVFYVAPEPGAPPYVRPGDRVEADATVGLVEVMKMFNAVTAGVCGEVMRLLAANEEFVEYGQPLLLVRPDAGA